MPLQARHRRPGQLQVLVVSCLHVGGAPRLVRSTQSRALWNWSLLSARTGDVNSGSSGPVVSAIGQAALSLHHLVSVGRCCLLNTLGPILKALSFPSPTLPSCSLVLRLPCSTAQFPRGHERRTNVTTCSQFYSVRDRVQRHVNNHPRRAGPLTASRTIFRPLHTAFAFPCLSPFALRLCVTQQCISYVVI